MILRGLVERVRKQDWSAVTIELVLVGSPMAKGRPLKIADESVAQVLALDEVAGEDGEVVLAPRGAHSEKPAEVVARIARMYPDASKCELFARAERPGWTCATSRRSTGSRRASAPGSTPTRRTSGSRPGSPTLARRPLSSGQAR